MENKKFKITYDYDPLNRLSSVTYDGGAGKRYEYDRAGNLVAITTTIDEKSKRAVDKPVAMGAAPGEMGGGARDKRFAAMEEEYKRLNNLARSGSISAEQFQEAINRFRFQDGEGIWWQLGHEGIWLRWNGTAWQ